jgi:hypothetical protein
MTRWLLRILLVCASISVVEFSGLARAAALPPDPPDAVGMHIIGAVDVALCDTTQPIPGPNGDNCTPKNSRAYSKNGDWPITTHVDRADIFNTGCYESGVNPSQFVTGKVMPGCFRVVDVKDPTNPKRIAEVYVYDTVNSPPPPPPSDSYWSTPDVKSVWTDPSFNGKNCTIYDGNKFDADCTATGNSPFKLTISTACRDWVVGPNGEHVGQGWIDSTGPIKNTPSCWDKGWITRTHFTAGADGQFKHPEFGFGYGHNEFIYWVNTQRQGGAANTRPSYTGISFYDLSDPHHPKYLSRIEATVHIDASGSYSNATNIDCDGKGVHHGNFDGRYAYLDWCEYGFIGDILTIVDANNPKHPKLASQWWVPGQKDTELAIRNSRDIDPVTGLEIGWKPVPGFQPVTRDVTQTASNPNPTGLLQKDVSLHFATVYKIKGKDIAFCEWHSAGLVILDVTDKKKPKFLSRFDYLTPDFQVNDKTGPVEPTTGLSWAELDHQVCWETWKNPATWTNSSVDPTEAAAGRIACGYSHSGRIVPETNHTIFWVADEYFTVPYGHLRMFDVSHLKHPKLLSHFLLPPKDPNGPLPSTNSTTWKVSKGATGTVTADPNGTQVYSTNWAAMSENFALGKDYPKRGPSTHLGNAYNSKLFIKAWYGAGVIALDISNPKHVKEVGKYPFVIQDGKGGAATYDVIFDHRGNLVVTDSNDGVRILKYTGPGAPLYTGPGTPALKFDGHGKDWHERWEPRWFDKDFDRDER